MRTAARVPFIATMAALLGGLHVAAAGAADVSRFSIGQPMLQAALVSSPTAGPRTDQSNTFLALLLAGGGPQDYKSLTLIGIVAGPNANTEMAKLTRRYDAPTIKAFITVLDFVVIDALRLMKRDGLALPGAPVPDPADGRALSTALYAAGVKRANDTYGVDVMFDRLLSERLSAQITREADAKFGKAANDAYRAVALALMTDLKAAYSI